MELPNHIKAKIVQQKIDEIEQEKYGFKIDHEVQIFLGNSSRVKEIETALANCVKIVELLNGKLKELSAPVVEHANGNER